MKKIRISILVEADIYTILSRKEKEKFIKNKGLFFVLEFPWFTYLRKDEDFEWRLFLPIRGRVM